jgi:ATP diphosphatase
VSTGDIAQLATAAEVAKSEDMVGELLFAVVDLARRIGVDPESALRKRASATLITD